MSFENVNICPLALVKYVPSAWGLHSYILNDRGVRGVQRIFGSKISVKRSLAKLILNFGSVFCHTLFVTSLRGRQDFHHYHEHTKHMLGGGVPRPMFAFPKFKNDITSEK